MTYPETAWHRNYVAHNALWSTGADVFQLLLRLGLKQDDRLVDIGAGSLRVGRFLIVYLNRGCYRAIEPNRDLFHAGVDAELTEGLLIRKEVRYKLDADMDAGKFGEVFDWVLIGDVLVHGDHEMMRDAMAKASAVLQPGGKLVVNYYPGNPHHDGTGWLYPEVAHHTAGCYTERLPEDMAFEEVGVVTGTNWCVLTKQ